MRQLALALACLAIPSVNLAAPALKERKEDDRDRIVGRWVEEQISMRGAEPGVGQSRVFRFGKDGTCGLTQGQQGAAETAGKYTLDTGKSPRRMQWLHGEKLTEWTCLYQLEGDRLRVAFVDQNSEPPPKLEPANNLTIYYLKRIKD
jgi:uncharacterized protein (TIGR03067 family)